MARTRRLKRTWNVGGDITAQTKCHIHPKRVVVSLPVDVALRNVPKIGEGSACNHAPDSDIREVLSLALLIASGASSIADREWLYYLFHPSRTVYQEVPVCYALGEKILAPSSVNPPKTQGKQVDQYRITIGYPNHRADFDLHGGRARGGNVARSIGPRPAPRPRRIPTAAGPAKKSFYSLHHYTETETSRAAGQSEGVITSKAVRSRARRRNYAKRLLRVGAESSSYGYGLRLFIQFRFT
ncbi:hypothetical protein EVAR_103147_1 [Eumeta japonica]|uniref:Uncharacterized protein n=1 Tax=Eumeta variegata TaxID=151549 RepID=A0A4C1YC23_EUMVA|nr:hypothetical protein EVAR_103147_1 [Eumeta japonica]